MYFTFIRLVALVMLATPFAFAFTDVDRALLKTPVRSYVGGNANLASVIARHHAEAQKKAKTDARNLVSLEARVAHHTEAQIAAKQGKKVGARGVTHAETRARTEAEMAAGALDIESRVPHHTEV